jgi:hypothetical protein
MNVTISGWSTNGSAARRGSGPPSGIRAVIRPRSDDLDEYAAGQTAVSDRGWASAGGGEVGGGR